MPVRRGGVPDEALEFGASQTARHGFALGEGSKCRGVAYLTAQLHAGYRGLQVIGVRHSTTSHPAPTRWIVPSWENSTPVTRVRLYRSNVTRVTSASVS